MPSGSLDFGRVALFALDLPVRLGRKIFQHRLDYRACLFEDLRARLNGTRPRRILEIGPRDGEDTRRLATIGAEQIVLVDLPNQRARIENWLPELAHDLIKVVYGNIMYDPMFDAIEPFDVVWCTGVLYHNPEQLRFIRQLFDLLTPGGYLVLETATARRRTLRSENCVEIWFPPDKVVSRRYHLSTNITHLPSRKAVGSWLELIGFVDITRSTCHRQVTRSLAATRAAYLARRPSKGEVLGYYSHADHNFPIGRAR
jgi:SAM-dependent methyltransferase